ncbi:MAG: glycosyltransferase [bacterium]|jgi:glycosyltransferase involved in cell wall biosynthesis
MAELPKSNILYVSHDTGILGGAERQLIELLKGLSRDRFTPHLVCLEPGGPVGRAAVEIGLPLTVAPRKWRWDLGVITRLYGYIKREDIAIVHPYLGLPGFYGAVAAKLAGRKAITTIRIAGPRRRVADSSERIGFLISDLIIANSHAGVEHYFKHWPGREKTRVIYNGYNIADFDPAPTRPRAELGLPEKGLLIGHVANLTYLKDYPTFLAALAQVFEKYDDAHAVILGEGDRRGDYEALARQLGIASRTIFMGHRKDVLDIARHFDIGVLASHGDYSEGLSNSICEYMGLAKPVVATAMGGNRELVRTGVTGLLATPGNANDLAAKMLALAGDEKTRVEMGRKGREFFLGNLGLDVMVSRTERVYEDLLKG